MDANLSDLEVSDNEGEGPEGGDSYDIASATLKPVTELVMAPIEANANAGSSQRQILAEVKSKENRDDDSGVCTIFVEYQQMKRLPYRGGYFNKRNGKKYLHAGMQTDRKPKPKRNVQMFSRQTQKCLVRNQNWNTIRETFTQMDRRDLVLDWSRDYARVPGRYVDSVEWAQIRRSASIMIQKYTRRWIARRRAKRIREFIKTRLEVWFTNQVWFTRLMTEFWN